MSLLIVRQTIKSYALYVIMLLYENIYTWLLCTVVVLVFKFDYGGSGAFGGQMGMIALLRFTIADAHFVFS